MIISNPPDKNRYHLAFTNRKKDIPPAIFIDRPHSITTEAKINKEKRKIKIVDVHLTSFSELMLMESTIILATNATVKELQKNLLKRFGERIETDPIYVILYKVI